MCLEKLTRSVTPTLGSRALETIFNCGLRVFVPIAAAIKCAAIDADSGRGPEHRTESPKQETQSTASELLWIDENNPTSTEKLKNRPSP